MKKVGVFMMVLCLLILLPLTAEPLAAFQSSNDVPVLIMNPDMGGPLLAKKGGGKDPTGWKKRKETQDQSLERQREQKEGDEEELLEKREKREQKWLKQEDKWRQKREQMRNRIEKIEKEELKLKGEKEKLQKELETMEEAVNED